MTPLRGQADRIARPARGFRCAATGYLSGVDVLLLILLIGAAVCFGLAAANVATRVNLVALGLLLWVLTAVIPAIAAA